MWQRTEADRRARLIALFFVGLGISIFNFIPAEQQHGELVRFLIVVGIAGIVGAMTDLFFPAIGWMKGALVSMAGNVVPLGAFFLFLFWVLSITGRCFG